MSILRKKVKSLSCVQLFATPMNYTRLLSPWKLSRQEYWSGLAFPPPGDLPNPGMEPRSPTLQADALSSEPPGKPTSKIWWQRDSGFHYLCLLLLAVSEGRQLLCCEVTHQRGSCPKQQRSTENHVSELGNESLPSPGKPSVATLADCFTVTSWKTLSQRQKINHS